MKKSTLITGLIIIVVLIVLGWMLWPKQAAQNSQGMAGPGGAGGQGPVAVETLQVKEQSIEVTMELPARLVAYRRSEVRPQVSGIIEKRLFEQGSLVEKGQQLYQLDDARYMANLKSAKADLLNAKAQQKTIAARSKRIQSLVAKKAVSEQDLDDVMAQLEQAKAAIAVAQSNVDLQQINIDYAEIKAPISGRIGQSFLTEGALVSTGQEQALAIITQLDPLYVDMKVSTDRARQVMKVLSNLQSKTDNSDAQLTVNIEQPGNQEPIVGKLEFSDVVVDESTGAITLRALVDNENLALLPGMFVSPKLNLGEVNELLVPQRATSRNPQGGLDLWVVNDDNTAEKVTVQSNQSHGNQWVISSGLKPNQTIVVSGYQKLQPGSEVQTSPWKSPDDTSAKQTAKQQKKTTRE